ncbi:LLM class flavin-dependent oxidoreductase [Aeromicrobium panaciterrae]|uniref:LLM class flavin-dependent oxidoreductase n=1 Tax=Aeromicrobium panaciterrae TaxID=363861 RepID=UPI0031D717A5
MAQPDRMDFGVFIAPFHANNDNPTLTLRHDLELIELADKLGFDEAWVGEHHSTGVERIADPFMVLSAAAVQTTRIRLGTGVSSLPYHHPFMVADRVVLLDHLSRGRAMLGVGPGALISDADMMGIEPVTQRARMNEALDAIIQLLNGEVVSTTTEWFELREAQLAFLAYNPHGIPIAVASTTSPSGVTSAGRHGIGVLSLSAGFIGGKKDMKEQWAIAEKSAADAGKEISREGWRMVLRVHLADDREQAIRDVEKGRLAEREDYFKPVLGLENDYTLADEIADDSSIIGTPDDAIAAIERMIEQTGGFGGFMIMTHDWANRAASLNSLELFARYVIPHFQGTLVAPQRSADAVTQKRPSYKPLAQAAITKAFSDAGRDLPEGTNIQSLR